MDSDTLLTDEDLLRPDPTTLKSKYYFLLCCHYLPLLGNCGPASGKKKACKNWSEIH